ncbi:MAG: histidinol dehydrogenase [Gemmatimonadales bacterium]|nr:MAG: histidinol dehydrogenase [Gemmatimonadales bacterium]
MPKIAIDTTVSALDDEQRAILLDRRPGDEARLKEAVRSILTEVRQAGDAPLFRMAREFDRVELESLEIPRARWDEALMTLDPDVRAALERAARNLDAFHRAQIPAEVTFESEPGVRLGRRSTPLPAVGVYAPGGLAAYPSSVLMGVVPARAAGVPEIVVCSPPGPEGEPPAEVLAACAIGGATRLFVLGGAGAIAAMAYGTPTVPRVEAIVGPGNQWVTEAKRQVAGELRIDSPAGPSEVLVIAGPGADAELVAGELVAQAEHDPEAAVAVVSWNAPTLDRVRVALAEQVARAPRAEIIRSALADRGAILLAASRAEALDLSQAYAAEHLTIFTDDPRGDLDTQTTAGTVFVGEPSTVAFGDYMTGANHVLPTAGRSRAFSGLSVLEFLRFYTWQELTPEAAALMADDVGLLADAEGLPGHAAAARARRTGAAEARQAASPHINPTDLEQTR